MLPLPTAPFALALLLTGHGLHKRALSPSGAAAAFVVGHIMMSVQLYAFGVALIIFYLTGPRATKMGKALKQQLEEGHQAAGYRNDVQVFSNSLSAAVAAFLWSASALYDPHSWVVKGPLKDLNLDLGLGPRKVSFDVDRWCPTYTTCRGVLESGSYLRDAGALRMSSGRHSGVRAWHPLAFATVPPGRTADCPP